MEDIKTLSDAVVNELKPLIAEQSKKIEEQAKTIDALKSEKEKTEKEFNDKVDSKVKELIRTPEFVKEFNIVTETEAVRNKREGIKFATALQYMASGLKEKALNYLGEGSTSIGGAAITPAYMNDQIIADLGKYGLLPNLVSPYVLSKPTATVYWPAALTGATMTKVTEASAISTSSPTFSQPTGTVYKWARTVAVSNEAIQDAELLAQYLPQLLAEAAAYALDLEWLNTTSIGLCQTVPTANKVAIGGTDATVQNAIRWTDFVDAEAGLSTTMRQNAVYIMHPTVLGAVRKITDNENRPVFDKIFVNKNGGVNAMDGINGFPVFATDVMPAGTAADTVFATLCDPKMITRWAIVKGFEMEAFRSGSDGDSVNALTQDMTIFRFIMRANVTNFVPVDVNGNAKGLFGLKTAAS